MYYLEGKEGMETKNISKVSTPKNISEINLI